MKPYVNRDSRPLEPPINVDPEEMTDLSPDDISDDSIESKESGNAPQQDRAEPQQSQQENKDEKDTSQAQTVTQAAQESLRKKETHTTAMSKSAADDFRN